MVFYMGYDGLVSRLQSPLMLGQFQRSVRGCASSAVVSLAQKISWRTLIEASLPKPGKKQQHPW